MSKIHDWFSMNNKKPFNKMLVLWWALGLAVVCGIFYFIIFMNAGSAEASASAVVFEEGQVNEDNVVFPIIHFTEEITNTFNNKFNSTTNEFVYCLYGDVSRKGYFIENIVEPKVKSATTNRIHFMSCKPTNKYIGTIHSHPKGINCRLSVQDGISFGISSAKIGDKLAGVICGEDDFNMFTLTNTKTPLELEVI